MKQTTWNILGIIVSAITFIALATGIIMSVSSYFNQQNKTENASTTILFQSEGELGEAVIVDKTTLLQEDGSNLYILKYQTDGSVYTYNVNKEQYGESELKSEAKICYLEDQGIATTETRFCGTKTSTKE